MRTVIGVLNSFCFNFSDEKPTKCELIYNGLVLLCTYMINITFCPPVFVRIVCNLLDPDEFESDVSSVAELGYFYRIPEPKVSFPDSGQKDPGSGSAPMDVLV